MPTVGPWAVGWYLLRVPRRRSTLPPVDYAGHTLTVGEYFRHAELGLDVRHCELPMPVLAHDHEFVEIVYVARGTALHEMYARGGDRVVRRDGLLPGDCFVVAPGERHAYLGNDGLLVVNVLLTRGFLAAERGRLGDIPGARDLLVVEPLLRRTPEKLHLAIDQREPVVASLDAMIGECARAAPGFASAARAHFALLMVQLGRAWLASSRGRPPEPRAVSAAVDAAIACMEDRLREQISLGDIADAAGLSRTHLARLFRRACGVTPWTYLTRLRVARAQVLLRSRRRSIRDVGAAVGFPDPAYFARVFRAAVGDTPRRWQERHAD